MPEPDINKTKRMSSIITPRHVRQWLFSGLCLLALSACGTVPNRPAEDVAPGNGNAQTGAAYGERDTSRDPLEGFNRAMYTFNDKLDRYVLKPLAKGYRAITDRKSTRLNSSHSSIS